jgi:predicted glycosyltransferase
MKRILFYSHDSFGLGHFRRSLSIAGYLARRIPSTSALMLTGLDSAATFEAPPGVDFVKLPGIAKSGPDQYQSRHLRVSFSRVQRIREQLIHGVVRAYNPDLFVVDNVPRGVEGELLPTLRYLKRRRPHTRIVLTMRDVLDTPANIVPLWRRVGMFGVLDEYYDEIWIVGCQSVFDPVALYEMPARLARKVRFCGYVVRGSHAQVSADIVRELRLGGEPCVTVSCGGGGDGYALIDAYVDAGKQLAAKGVKSFVFLGPDMPPGQRRRLKERLLPLSENIHTFDYRPDLISFLQLSTASLSMAGYNTVCELVSLRKAAVVVPRVQPRLEQLLRARALADRGLLEVVMPDDLVSRTLFDALHTAIAGAAARSLSPLPSSIDFGGLRRIARRARIHLALKEQA